MNLNGRLAVVTGGAQGIGYAVAKRFIASGARVILWDREGDATARAAESLGPTASSHAVELAHDDEITAAALTAGPVDILVNNAGITGGNGKTWDLAPTIWREVIEVNLNAPDVTCRALIPGMIARGYGRIIIVALVAGKEDNPNTAHYSASKAGLIALTTSLGKELAGTGVLVNAITPAVARRSLSR